MHHFKAFLNNLLTNSTIIAIPIITCFGYVFAYQYEIGSANYYHIPEYLVQVDLLKVIYNAVALYAVVFSLGFLIYSIASDFSKLQPPILLRTLFKPPVGNRRSTYWILTTLVILVIILILPNILGRHLSEGKEFFVTFQKNKQDYILVKVYGDVNIALAYDEKKRVLKRDILLIPTDKTISGTVKYFEDLQVE